MKQYLLAGWLSIAVLTSNAQFSGDFAPANWTTTTEGSMGIAEVITSTAPDSITIVGPELTDAFLGGTISYWIIVPETQTINFDYNVNHLDDFEQDSFYVYRNSDMLLGLTGTQIGTFSELYDAGDTLRLAVFSTDGGWGEMRVTIKNVDNAVLPVNGSALSVKSVNGQQYLLWTTYTESNNKGFEIESSTDGKAFGRVAFVPTRSIAGNSNEQLIYQFKTAGSTAPSFYRYRQVDFDGKSAYSNVVKVDGVAISMGFVVYPNPASGNIRIVSRNAGKLTIMDITGKLVRESPIDNEIQLDLSALPGGMYTLSLNGESLPIVKK